MDTQTTGGGDLTQNSASKIPSLPKKTGAIEPPDNLPFVDEAVTEAVADVPKAAAVPEPPKADLPPAFKPLPKIVPGMRGPLPSAPVNPMKPTTAKFGIGKPLRAPAPALKPEPKIVKEEVKETNLPMVEEKDDVAVFVPEKKAPERPKISVPKPPVAPVDAVEKDLEDLLNEQEEKQSKKKSSGSVPPPTVPPPTSVDRNIRPRRLAIVVIVLLLFIAVIFFSLWYFFTRDNGSTAPTPPTDSSLFSPSPSSNATVVSPSPSADALSQTDSDADGLTDAQEIQLGTDPFKADTDGDGYSDKQELDAGYDPLVVGGKLDTDRDGFADPDELCWGTDKRNPDTDGDGYLDGQEVVNGYDPLIPSPNDKLSGVARCKI